MLSWILLERITSSFDHNKRWTQVAHGAARCGHGSTRMLNADPAQRAASAAPRQPQATNSPRRSAARAGRHTMDPLPLTWTTPRGSTGIVGSCSRSAAAVDCGAARESGIRRKWAAAGCRDPVPKGEEALSESCTIAHAMSAHAMIDAEGDNITVGQRGEETGSERRGDWVREERRLGQRGEETLGARTVHATEAAFL